MRALAVISLAFGLSACASTPEPKPKEPVLLHIFAAVSKITPVRTLNHLNETEDTFITTLSVSDWQSIDVLGQCEGAQIKQRLFRQYSVALEHTYVGFGDNIELSEIGVLRLKNKEANSKTNYPVFKIYSCSHMDENIDELH